MDSFGDAVARLRAAAEPTRLRLLRLLQNGEFNVKDLTQLLGQSQPRVSRHIKLLAEAGLIERYQEASWVFVRASSDPGVRSFIEAALSLIAAHDPQILRDAERSDKIRAARSLLAQTYFDQNAAEWDQSDRCTFPSATWKRPFWKLLALVPTSFCWTLARGPDAFLNSPQAARAASSAWTQTARC